MKVYIVVCNQSYDGSIYKGVFASEEVARTFVLDTYGYRAATSHGDYEIIEEDI